MFDHGWKIETSSRKNGTNGKSKSFGFAIIPGHGQKELMKFNGIEFYSNKIIIEDAGSTRIKRQDEQILYQSRSS